MLSTIELKYAVMRKIEAYTSKYNDADEEKNIE
jgi:hypothetical protein